MAQYVSWVIFLGKNKDDLAISNALIGDKRILGTPIFVVMCSCYTPLL